MLSNILLFVKINQVFYVIFLLNANFVMLMQHYRGKNKTYSALLHLVLEIIGKLKGAVLHSAPYNMC